LYNRYGKEVINLKGPIPGHLLGNMWAQDWTNIYDLVAPHPDSSRPDATQGLLDQVQFALFCNSICFLSTVGCTLVFYFFSQ